MSLVLKKLRIIMAGFDFFAESFFSLNEKNFH